MIDGLLFWLISLLAFHLAHVLGARSGMARAVAAARNAPPVLPAEKWGQWNRGGRQGWQSAGATPSALCVNLKAGCGAQRRKYVCEMQAS
jgi:hypothetical protein